MGIMIKLYGDLKENLRRFNNKDRVPNTLNIELNNIKTVFDIFEEFNIDQNDISTIFINGKYCGPGKEIKNGDRIGLFPKKMGLMFLEIIKSNSINVTIKLFDELKKSGPTEAFLEVPEGSTIKMTLDKVKLPKSLWNLSIMVNKKLCNDIDFIINNGDIIGIYS